MACRNIALALPALVLVAACASQRTDRAIAYGHFEDGDYAGAVEWARRAASRGEVAPETEAELVYLEARALESAGERGQARALYAYLAERHPQSRYGYLARNRLDGEGGTGDRSRFRGDADRPSGPDPEAPPVPDGGT